MKSLLFVFLLMVCFVFLSCASTYPVNGLNSLSDEEIEAYNSNPNNTDKIVCTKEAQIGTRVPKRVCRKQSVMDARARQDQGMTRDIQIHQTIGTRDGGG